jgi:hypothetical protein
MTVILNWLHCFQNNMALFSRYSDMFFISILEKPQLVAYLGRQRFYFNAIFNVADGYFDRCRNDIFNKSVPRVRIKKKIKTDSDSESVFIFNMAWCIVFSTFISINFFCVSWRNPFRFIIRAVFVVVLELTM